MSSLGGPSIVTDGLVLYLDAANKKSLADVPATNLFLQSETYTNASWAKANSNITSSTTPAPDTNASASTLTATGGFSNIRQRVTVPTGVYTVSHYVKYINQQYITIVHEGNPYGTSTFDLINGTKGRVGGTAGFAINNSITPQDKGFYRISTTFNVTQSSFTITPYIWFGGYNGNNNSGSQVHIWGSQFEAGPVPTTYIPTTSTIASRIPTFVDISRNSNNGTLINGPTYDYSNNGSLVFDGVDDNVKVSSIADTTFPQDTGTISIWYNIKSTNGVTSDDDKPIFDGFDGNRNHFFIRNYSNTSYTIQIGCNSIPLMSMGYVYVSNYNITVDAWHNIVVTYTTGTGSSVKVYIDGVLANSGTISDTTWRPTGQFTGFGSTRGLSYIGAMQGKGGPIKIYNRALTAQEILQNYNAIKSRFGL